MVWTAPDVVRVDESFVGDARTVLAGFLEFGRSTLLLKCAGLTGEQLATRALPPSALSLLGLVRHVADVERTWLRRRSRRPPARTHRRNHRDVRGGRSARGRARSADWADGH